MTTQSHSDGNKAPETPKGGTAPAAKPSRKHRMAREPDEALAAAQLESTAPAEAEIDATPSSPPMPVPTKITTVFTLLRRDDGATLEEMIATTGWLPHTTRAVLTGLRKKGHVIERAKRDDVTIWRIAGEA